MLRLPLLARPRVFNLLIVILIPLIVSVVLTSSVAATQARSISKPIGPALTDRRGASAPNASVIVTSPSDSGVGSLRDAVNIANLNDTIQFSLPINSIIVLSSELVVTRNLTIDGSTATNLKVSGNAASRVFSATAPATFIGFSVVKGNAATNGGGINSENDLTLTNMIFFNNTAHGTYGGGVSSKGFVNVNGGSFVSNSISFLGGGLYGSQGVSISGTQFLSNTAGIDGGGLSVNDALLTNTTFINNSAIVGDGGGAVIYFIGSVKDGSFESNKVLGGYGGGLAVYETLNLSGTRFLSNTAISGGGGLFVYSDTQVVNATFISNTTAASGGGADIANGIATLIGSSFERNTAVNQDGGGLWANNLSLSGTQFLTNTALGYGGGLYAKGIAAITNATFISNSAQTNPGGGAYFNALTTINGGYFGRNTALAVGYGAGGGAYAYKSVSIIGTQFLSNTAYHGGGLETADSLNMLGTQFQSNVANQNGGGVYANASTNLTDVIFINNTAAYYGGGLHNTFGVVRVMGGLFDHNTAVIISGGGLNAGNLTMSGTQLLNNHAGQSGGGLRAYADMTLTQVIFLNNYAAYTGGGLQHLFGATSQVINTIFAGNVSNFNHGGAMAFESTNGSAKILHTTIASSTVGSGSAIYVVSETVGITNSIIASYTTGIGNTDGHVTQDYNLFFSVPITQSGSINNGVHDVFGDPKFVNPSVNNYHVLSTSAAIDVGINVGVFTDLEGNVRPGGFGFDLGAYEYPKSIFKVYLPLALKNF